MCEKALPFRGNLFYFWGYAPNVDQGRSPKTKECSRGKAQPFRTSLRQSRKRETPYRSLRLLASGYASSMSNSTFIHLTFAERLSDRLNPIVVKELRQAVQSRFVTAMLLVLLAIQLTAVGLYLLMSAPSSVDYNAGRSVFAILFTIMMGVSLVFVPAYTAVRMIAERSDTNVDLLFITTIKPRSIVAGKLLTAIVLTILIMSACLPFMVFTYFLRGIDLITIFFILAYAFMVIVSSGLLALLLGSLPYGRTVKAFLSLLLLAACFIAFFSAVGMSFWFNEASFGAAYDTWTFWEPVLTTLLIAGGLFGFVVVLCVALLTPLSANRALPVRLYLTLAWSLTLLTATIWSRQAGTSGPLALWVVLMSLVLSAMYFGAVSEREESGARVLRTVSAHPLKRWLSFLLASGSANGLAWASLFGLLTLGLPAVWLRRHRFGTGADDLRDVLIFASGMLAYFYAYAVSGALLRRWWLRRLPSQLTWIISAILLLLGVIVPVMSAFFALNGVSYGEWRNSRWLVMNAFALGGSDHDWFYGSLAAAFALLVTLLNAPWFVARVKAFAPPGLRRDSDGAES